MSEEIVVIEDSTAEIAPIEADALEVIDRRNALFDKMLAVAIRSTSTNDWVDQSGKPFLQSSGSEKVGRRFAVKIFDTDQTKEDYEDEDGKYIMFTTTGKVGFNEVEYITVMGACSTRDKFFGKVGGAYKPLKDIDLTNIKKKSYTNFMSLGIQKLIGIRNLSWKELEKYGIGRGGKAIISYKKSEPKPSSKVEPKNKPDSKPYWTSEHNDKKYLFVKKGNHFSEEFLKEFKFIQTKKNPINYFIEYTDGIFELVKGQDSAKST